MYEQVKGTDKKGNQQTFPWHVDASPLSLIISLSLSPSPLSLSLSQSPPRYRCISSLCPLSLGPVGNEVVRLSRNSV